MNKKVLVKDNATLSIVKESDLNEYLEFRAKNDRWMEVPVDKMRILSAEDVVAADFRKAHNVLISVDEIAEHIEEGNKFFLEFFTDVNGEEKRGVVPVRWTALRSILERAKISGFSLVNNIKTPDTDVLTGEEKASIINMCLRLYHQRGKILYRDRKVSSVMSGQYAILGEADIVNAVRESLNEEFSGLEFVEGSVSHELFRIEYKLNADEIEEDLMIALDEAGLPADNIETRVGVFTSDIGSACATVFGSLIIDGKRIVFGKPQGVKHMGSKNMGDLKNATNKLYSMFKDNMEAIKKLSGVTIHYPAGCLRSIAKEFKLPKKYTMDVAVELESRTVCSETTAYEIYWCLNEVLTRYEKENKSIIQLMQFQEAVARTLKTDYKKFDKPFEWTRGETNE